MPLMFAAGRPLYFAHVPKAGGSSVEDYLEARFGPLVWLDRLWERKWQAGGWRDASLRTSPQHIDAAMAAQFMPTGPAPSFAVVRDPLTRVVSEYRYQAGQRRGRRRLTKAGFSTWLHLALTAARRAPTLFDNHLRPQSDIVPQGATVFRLEDGFAPLVDWLDRVTGAAAPDLVIGHALRSPHVPAIPRGPDLALIAKVYAADFTRFGYPLPDPAAAPPDRAAPLRAALAAAAAPALAAAYERGRL